MKPYLFFDAGGTVIFPDFAAAARLLRDTGYPIDTRTLFRIFSTLLYEADVHPDHRPPGGLFPSGFLAAILERAGLPPEQAALFARHLEETAPGLGWSATFPWVRPALVELREQGYGMSVISNSDGRVAERLAHAGLDDLFDRIIDSAVVGCEKPDPSIFRIAMEELNLEPSQCLHLGDMYYYDVLGANRARVAAVLLDPFGLSVGRPGMRIRTVADYPHFLAGINGVGGPGFHPLGRE